MPVIKKSYFARYANATLIFSVPSATGEVVIDEDTGNETRSLTTITITALLKQSKLASSYGYQSNPGADTPEIKVSGYIVTPFPYIPDTIKPLMVATATISGRVGKFRIEKVIRSPYGDAAIVGDKLEGVFYE